MSSDLRVDGWNFKKYRDGTILITTLLLIISAAGILFSPSLILGVILSVCLILWLVVLYFFRDPDRPFDRSADIVYSPGDGVIQDITHINDESHNEKFVCIGIFLSVFDIHVQRIPLSGKIAFVTHNKGKNHPAYHPAASVENDQISMGIDTKHGMITVKQISGILARKCINYASVGDQVQSGQRYGLIKFGSRVEIYMPSTAKLLCTIGDKLRGGLTPIAELPNEGNRNV